MTPPFTLLNGQAGIDVNDRCEVAKIRHTHPKTIVFVFAEGRQTGDKEFVWDMLHQCHTEGFWKKVADVCFSSDGLPLSGVPLRRERKWKVNTLVFYMSQTTIEKRLKKNHFHQNSGAWLFFIGNVLCSALEACLQREPINVRLAC